MPKKKDRNRSGPRTIPAHWQTPQETATATAVSANPGDWPVGPCWATRVDHSGNQGLFLTRQRPWGRSLTAVGAVVNDQKGIVDGMGDYAIAPAHLADRVAEMGHPSHHAYAVSPEYVRFRLAQGEALSGDAALPAPYRRQRHLLDAVDATWTPDFAALEERLHRPDLLEQTALLLYGIEFNDWRAGADDDEAVKAFVEAADKTLAALDGGGLQDAGDEASVPDLAALSETETLVEPWLLTEEGSMQMDALVGEHLEKVVRREVADRHRERLLQMAYLTDLDGKPTYSSLIATAAWSLRPDSETLLAENAFIRALMRKTVEMHLVGGE